MLCALSSFERIPSLLLSKKAQEATLAVTVVVIDPATCYQPYSLGEEP